MPYIFIIISTKSQKKYTFSSNFINKIKSASSINMAKPYRSEAPLYYLGSSWCPRLLPMSEATLYIRGSYTEFVLSKFEAWASK